MFIKCLHDQGELKLLHDENDMLREQVVNLANQQTNGETTENSSTESAERLENLCKLYRPKQGESAKGSFRFHQPMHFGFLYVIPILMVFIVHVALKASLMF